MKRAILLTFVVLGGAAPATAATAPLVPKATQIQVKDLLTQFNSLAVAYMPTAAPKHYYLANFGASPNLATYTVADSRYPVGSNKERAVFFFFEPFKGRLAQCRRSRNGAMSLGAVKIYFEGFAAWRCVLAPSGRLVKLVAKSSIIRGSELGFMVAAIRRIP